MSDTLLKTTELTTTPVPVTRARKKSERHIRAYNGLLESMQGLHARNSRPHHRAWWMTALVANQGSLI